MILYLVLLPLAGQEGNHFYGVNGEPVKSQEDAIELREVKQKSGKKYVIRFYLRKKEKWNLIKKEKIRVTGEEELRIRLYENKLFPETYYRSMQAISPDSYFFKETRLEQIIREGESSSYLPLHLEGTVEEYYPNGQLKSKSIYRNNQLLSNENWLPDGSPYIDSIFYSADAEPEYKLGNLVFRSHVMQSLIAAEIDPGKIEDQVVIGWVIMENGKLEGAIPLSGKSRGLNQLLANAISDLPGTWEPAKLNGEPIRYFMSVPINFMQREVMVQDLEFSGGMLHYDVY